VDRLEAVGYALRELGDASAEQLCGFIEQRFGLRIEPKYLPLFKATLLDQQRQVKPKQMAHTTDQPSAA
jgi:hypothetical protein